MLLVLSGFVKKICKHLKMINVVEVYTQTTRTQEPEA